MNGVSICGTPIICTKIVTVSANAASSTPGPTSVGNALDELSLPGRSDTRPLMTAPNNGNNGNNQIHSATVPFSGWAALFDATS